MYWKCWILALSTVLFDEAIPNYAAFDASNPDFNIHASGDQLLALCATSFSNVNQITFLAAVNANSSSWDADATTALPPGLTNGTTAKALGNVAEALSIPLPPFNAVVTYAYSKNGGTSFQSDTAFANLAPGFYPIVIKNENTGCTAPFSATPVVLEAPTLR